MSGDGVKLDRRYDWVGPPDKVSKIRPIKLRKLPNETVAESAYRQAREELTEWNSEFWRSHNELFERKRAEFVAERKRTRSRIEQHQQIPASEMSVFYKNFLNQRAPILHAYNKEWYRRNFGLIFPAIRVNWIRFCRLIARK